MKLKRYLKNSISLALILSSCFLGGCFKRPGAPAGKTNIEKEFIKSFTSTANVAYPLDIQTKIAGKTFWIYIATDKDILTLSPASSSGGLTPEKFIKFMEIKCNYDAGAGFALDYIFLKYSDEEKAQEKDMFEQSAGGTLLYQDYTDTVIEILQKTYSSIGDIIDKAEDMNFFAIAVANTKKGIKITFAMHRIDIEQFLLGMLPSDEFYNRMIIKAEGSKEIINDRLGLHLQYNDISLINFLREQIVNHARAVIGELERYEPEKLKTLDTLDDILFKSVYDVSAKYEFNDYLSVAIKNIVTRETLSLDKSELVRKFSEPSPVPSPQEYNS